MKLYFRLFWLIVTQGRRSRSSILGPVDTHLRVLPNDLDALLHVNNGVYLTLMDLGRTDLLLRCGAFKLLRNKGWYPVLAAESIRFRKSLKLWQRFTITTTVVGWDDRSIYLEQVFTSKGSLVAKAVVDARFLSKKGERITPAMLMDFLSIEEPAPEMPEWIESWALSNKQMPLELS